MDITRWDLRILVREEWAVYTFKGVVRKEISFCVGSNLFYTSSVKLSFPLSHTCPHSHSEVRQSLGNAQTQYSQWCMLLDSEADIDKIQGVGSELKNCIKSIEWDLEDLDQTISILPTLNYLF